MNVLGNLQPQEVFHFFEEISRIPHGSGNVGAISDYLVEFAKKRGLKVVQDALKNVIIFRDATPGYEEEPVLILQGHMDMVAVKKPGCDIDLGTDGLRLAVDGDNLYADGTSLGGDDGIAVAYALAILDSHELRHPALEVVLTVDEETGMDGARGIDLSGLRGSRLLNLDSEKEGVFLASCAGGVRVLSVLSDMLYEAQEAEPAFGKICSLQIGGLLGGHSGDEIDKGRGNSNQLFGRVLYRICRDFPVRLIGVSGGLADNAIPRGTQAWLLLPEQTDGIESLLKTCEEEICSELGGRDPGFAMQIRIAPAEGGTEALSVDDTRKVAAWLAAFPNGVMSMCEAIPGLVETSLNLGILRMERGKVTAVFSVRSSVESAKEALVQKLYAVTELVGGTCEVFGDYPGWKYRPDSPLRDKMIRVYREMYGTEPKVDAIHAGLECGILGNKLRDLDCVSIGPDMQNIHTTEETLSISSTRRVWEYLVKLLETKG